jgi:hypothetical protein
MPRTFGIQIDLKGAGRRACIEFNKMPRSVTSLWTNQREGARRTILPPTACLIATKIVPVSSHLRGASCQCRRSIWPIPASGAGGRSEQAKPPDAQLDRAACRSDHRPAVSPGMRLFEKRGHPKQALVLPGPGDQLDREWHTGRIETAG